VLRFGGHKTEEVAHYTKSLLVPLSSVCSRDIFCSFVLGVSIQLGSYKLSIPSVLISTGAFST